MWTTRSKMFLGKRSLDCLLSSGTMMIRQAIGPEMFITHLQRRAIVEGKLPDLLNTLGINANDFARSACCRINHSLSNTNLPH